MYKRRLKRARALKKTVKKINTQYYFKGKLCAIDKVTKNGYLIKFSKNDYKLFNKGYFMKHARVISRDRAVYNFERTLHTLDVISTKVSQHIMPEHTDEFNNYVEDIASIIRERYNTFNNVHKILLSVL